MRLVRNQAFFGLRDRDSAGLIADLQIVDCAFSNCALSITSDPALRTTVRNVELIDVEVHACRIWSVVVEDVRIINLHTKTLLQTWGAVFNRTILRGRIGSFMCSSAIRAGMAEPEIQAAFDSANARYYEKVEWALDIAEAEFHDCTLRGIPASLIRRDPSTQVIVTRERALSGGWRTVDLANTHWATAIELFLERGEPDMVLVAGKAHPQHGTLLAGLERLRDAGIAV
jgi:hypothetical protein